jgi:hypothetical protein
VRFPGFIGPSYTLPSVNVDCQRCVNFFPELNDLGTGKEKEVAFLVPAPGKRLLLTLPEDEIRGFWTSSTGTLFVVAGSKLYSVSEAWVATELGSLDTSTGPVSIADNGLQVAIVDGHSAYYWDLEASTFNFITLPSGVVATQITYQDGYFIVNSVGTSNFYISGIRAITFDPLDVGDADGKPDALVGVISANQSLLLFGSQSGEVYYNSGDADFPFARMQGAVVPVGCKAPFSIKVLGGQAYWVGADENGSAIVYRAEGFKATRISTFAVENVIRGMTSEAIAASTAWAYQQGGHLFYCLNLSGTDSTWVYDATTGLWHERQYQNLWSLERDRVEVHAVAYGYNVVGDYQNGNVYALDLDYYSDNGTPIARIRRAPHVSDGLKFIRHNSFQLDLETGVGTSGSGQGINPQVMLRWSDDGGHTWSNEYWVEAGRIGEYKARAIWRRLGSSRDRIYEVRMTDPVKWVLIGAEIDVEKGAA